MRFRVSFLSGLCGTLTIKGIKMKEMNITKSESFNTASFVSPWIYVYRVIVILFVRKLDHPHIVKFYGTSLLKKERTTRVILVMEKCRENLKSHFSCYPKAAPAKTANPAVVRDVCRWAEQITDALAFIHEQGIVHRNLKLEKILV